MLYSQAMASSAITFSLVLNFRENLSSYKLVDTVISIWLRNHLLYFKYALFTAIHAPIFSLKLLINSKHCWLMKQNKSRPRKSLHMKLNSSCLINLLGTLICKDSHLLFKRISCRYSFGPTVKFKPENIDERWFKFPFIAEISRILIEYSKQIIFKSLPDL